MRTFLAQLTVLLLISYAGFGQTQIGLPQVIQPSPTAMQFQKYGDYPVGGYTGVPDISIPLYTIKEGDLELPITMSYHAGGIKVSDANGFFGLGWSLNTGGLVSVTTIGAEDVNGNFPATFISSATINPCTWGYQTLDSLETMEEQGDLEHDMYFYSFGSQSGKFVINNGSAKTPILYPYKPIQVIPYPSGSTTFKIVDDKGVKYSFGTFGDGLGAYSNAAGGGGYNWNISQMVSGLSDSNKISFKYATSANETRWLRNETFAVDDLFSSLEWTDDPNSIQYYPTPYSNTGGTAEIAQNYQTSLPTEIDFTNGKILFSYSSTTGMLSRMDIYKANGQLLGSVIFLITHFAYQSTRYELAGIEFLDGNGNFINQYKFGYNNDYVMPDYVSATGIDFWGYYNGKDGNTNLIPNWTYTVQQDNSYPQAITVGGADRSADETFMKDLVLDTIQYPTGGSTIFQYEANRYDGTSGITQAGGLRLKSETSYNESGGVAWQKNYTYGNYSTYNSGTGLIDRIPSVNDYYYNQVVGILASSNLAILYRYRRSTFSSEPLVDIAPRGSPVVYPYITEAVSDGVNNLGSTIYEYDVEGVQYNLYPDVTGGNGNTNYKAFINPQEEWNWGGELIGKDVWSANGTHVSSLSNTYQEYDRDTVRNFQEYRFAVPSVEAPSGENDDPTWTQSNMDMMMSCENGGGSAVSTPFCYSDYYTITGEKRLISTVTSADGLVYTTTNYEYDNNDHIQPTKVTTIDSKGDTMITNLKYPADFATIAPYNTLITENRITAPLEQDKYKGSMFLQSQKTNYMDWGSGVIAPQTVQTQTLNDSPDIRVQFNAYDTRGNMLTVAKENDMPISYVWDYHGKEPVAQVKNAAVGDIAYTSFEADGGGNWTYSGATTVDPTSPTGNQCYNLSGGSVSKTGLTTATIYIVSYWSKNGGYTISGATKTTVGKSANGWTYYEHTVTGQTRVTVSGSGYIDELRLYPSGAEMSSFTYDPLVGQTSTVAANGIITNYVYDAAGRLKQIRDVDRNILKDYAYAFQEPGTGGGTSVAPNWVATGTVRYAPCVANPSYNSQEEQIQQKDMNSQSASYNQTRWLDYTNTGVSFSSDWQASSAPYCEQSNGYNTGRQLEVQLNSNPCSPLYNQTRIIAVDSNLTACPLPSIYYSGDMSGYYYSTSCPSPATPNPIFVTIPDSMFTSTISYADAINKAYLYGENYATEYGTCTVPPFDLQGINNSSTPIYVQATDNNTGTEYDFTIQPGASGTIGTIPSSTYTVRVYNAAATPANLYVGCSDYGYSGDETFNNVPLNATCNAIDVE